MKNIQIINNTKNNNNHNNNDNNTNKKYRYNNIIECGYFD